LPVVCSCELNFSTGASFKYNPVVMMVLLLLFNEDGVNVDDGDEY